MAGRWRLVALALVCLSEAVLGTDAPIRIRLGTYVPERSVGVQHVLLPWASAVEEALEGEVVVDTYFGGSLGRDPFAQYDLVRHGVLDVGWILAGYTSGQFPQLEIVELPFLAESAEEASVAAWRLHADGLLEGTDDVHVVTLWTTDVAGIHSRGRVESLDSLERRRIRSSGAVQAAFLELFGAASQTMGAVDANDALRRGTLDGTVQGWTGIRTFRTDQITHQLLEIPGGAIAFALLMNRDTWKRLAPHQQDAVMSAGGEALARRAGRAYDRIGADVEAEAISQRDYRVIRPDPATIQQYRDRVAGLHESWRRRASNGEDAYRHFVATLRAVRATPR